MVRDQELTNCREVFKLSLGIQHLLADRHLELHNEITLICLKRIQDQIDTEKRSSQKHLIHTASRKIFQESKKAN